MREKMALCNNIEDENCLNWYYLIPLLQPTARGGSTCAAVSRWVQDPNPVGKKRALLFGNHAVDGHANVNDGNVKILMWLGPVATALWAGVHD